MSHNTTRPGLNRSFTKLAVALVAASIATTATAGMALAGKEPPTLSFESAGCADKAPFSAEALLTVDGKGRWAYVEVQYRVEDSAWRPILNGTERIDMRAENKFSGVVYEVVDGPFDGPFDTWFQARPTDRNGVALVEDWTPSGSYTCPEPRA